MPMQPYYRETLGSYRNKPWGTGFQTELGTAIGVQEQLGDVISNSSIARTPKYQRYLHQKKTNWWGTVNTFGLGVISDYFATLTGVCDVGGLSYLPVDEDDSIANNKAIDQLYEQLRGDLDLAVDIAQAGQARAMVGSLARGLTDLVRTVRDIRRLLASAYRLDELRRTGRNIRRRWRRIQRQISAKWLEFVYGWKPLAQSAYNTLHRMMDSEATWVRAKGRGKQTSTTRDTVGSIAGVPIQRATTISTRVEVKATFKMKGSSLEALAGYTRNLESSLVFGSAFQHGYTTTTIRRRTEHYCGGSNQVGLTLSVVQLQAQEVTTRKYRKLLVGSPVPATPRLEVNLGATRLLNAAALASQRIR